MSFKRTNKFAGTCCVCGVSVPSQRGYLIKGSDVEDAALSKRKWLTLCTTEQCAVYLAGEEAVAEADQRALLADGTIVMPADPETKALRRAMGSWDAKRRVWVASPLYRDRDHVLAIADQLKLDVAPEFREYTDPEPVRLAVERARAIPTIREYQVAGVRWLAYRGLSDGAPADFDDAQVGGVLGDDPGAGKSYQTLGSLHDDEALVVLCPANAKAVWARETKWRPDRFDKITICDGAESFSWPENTRELVIINYDVLPLTPAQIKAEREKLTAERYGAKPDPDGKTKAQREGQLGLLTAVDHVAEEYQDLMHRDGGLPLSTADRHAAYLLLCEWVKLSDKLHKNRRAFIANAARKPAGKPKCPVLLVMDEVHYAQNNKAMRTAQCRHLAGKARRIYGLTGTPVEQDPLRLWGLLQTCKALPFTFGVFRDQFSAFDGQWGGIDFLRRPPPPGSTARGPVVVQPGTAEIVRRTLLRRRKADVLDELPDKIFSEIPIELSEKLVRECDEVASTYADFLLRGELPPFDAMAGVRKLIAAASVPAMLEIIAEYEERDEPLLVFSAHRGPVAKLAKRRGWHTITGDVSAKRRGEIEDAFQAEDSRDRGVAGTSAMATAMTLTRAATVLQVDPFWRRSDNEQAYDRAHRIGQKSTVHVLRIVPDHVLVRHAADLLVGKDTFVDDVLHASVEVAKPPSRFTKADDAEWAREVEAKAAADKAREEAVEQQRRASMERELAKIAKAEGDRLTPKTSEARAKARHERLGLLPSPYTTAPKADVQAALDYMLSVCDGAETRDDTGFNKPDGCVARWLAPGVRAGTQYALAQAAQILRHYQRQLSGRFPELFVEPLGEDACGS